MFKHVKRVWTSVRMLNILCFDFLQAFQQEITLNTNKIDALIVFGENLIQKSAPLDAVLIEDELEELHSYCQEVFGRVARFHYRLISRRPVSLKRLISIALNKYS